MIFPVILSGGSGTRLWPLSRENQPKQLLALGGPRTMLQETALRLSVIKLTSAVPRVTSVIRPTNPSPSTTGSLIATPALDPLSIVTVEYQTVGERPITLAVTGV